MIVLEFRRVTYRDNQLLKWLGPFCSAIPQTTGNSLLVKDQPCSKGRLIRFPNHAPSGSHPVIAAYDPDIHKHTVDVTITLDETTYDRIRTGERTVYELDDAKAVLEAIRTL